MMYGLFLTLRGFGNCTSARLEDVERLVDARSRHFGCPVFPLAMFVSAVELQPYRLYSHCIGESSPLNLVDRFRARYHRCKRCTKLISNYISGRMHAAYQNFRSQSLPEDAIESGSGPSLHRVKSAGSGGMKLIPTLKTTSTLKIWSMPQ
ncbi:hypothetical protein EDD15DRAFT_2263525 [Pisolithus albus]|nr:hypothetical protein EDD15DRAFT_2263525 [Pisolithus albus]